MTTSKIQPFQSGERLLARRQNQIVTPVNRMIEAGSDVLTSSSPAGVPRETFGALIDGSVEDGANRWTYTVTAVKSLKTQAGPDGYERVGANSLLYQVTARNSMEDGNEASGILGVGVDAEELANAGAYLEPVPDERFVRVYVERIQGGQFEYVFEAPNVIRSECPIDTDGTSLQVHTGF